MGPTSGGSGMESRYIGTTTNFSLLTHTGTSTTEEITPPICDNWNAIFCLNY